MARASGLLVVSAVVALHLPRAQAQSAEAEVLFQDGRALIKQGHTRPGCDKIAASERLEPSVGTLLNLGDCREQLGQYATAWAAFREAAAMAQRNVKDDKRQDEAERRAAAIEPKLSYLTVHVTARVADLVVKRDDVALDSAAFDMPLPVDPGRYLIVASAPGYKPWRSAIEVGVGKRQAIVVPALPRDVVARSGDDGASGLGPRASGRAETAHVELTREPKNLEVARPEARSPRPEALASPTFETAPPPAALVVTHHPGVLTPTRKVALGIGVAGLASIGAGVYFGFDARDQQADADRLCPTKICADPEGIRLNDRAQSSAMFANISYAVGGASIATSVVLWFVGAPGDPVVRPTFGDHQVGLVLTGRM